MERGKKFLDSVQRISAIALVILLPLAALEISWRTYLIFLVLLLLLSLTFRFFRGQKILCSFVLTLIFLHLLFQFNNANLVFLRILGYSSSIIFISLWIVKLFLEKKKLSDSSLSLGMIVGIGFLLAISLFFTIPVVRVNWSWPSKALFTIVWYGFLYSALVGLIKKEGFKLTRLLCFSIGGLLVIGMYQSGAIFLHYHKGENAYEEKQYNLALEKFAEASEINKKLKIEQLEAKACIYTGKIYFRQGDTIKANEYFEQAVTVAPTTGEVHMWIGDFYKENREWDKAFWKYVKCLRLNYEWDKATSSLAEVIAQKKSWYMLGTLLGWFGSPAFHYQLCGLVTENLKEIPPPVKRLKELTERNIKNTKSTMTYINLPEKVFFDGIQTIFGNELILYRYNINKKEKELVVSLDWIAITDTDIKEDYIIELSLSNEWGNIVLAEEFPIKCKRREIVRESHTIHLSHLPRGKYGINVAVYDRWRKEEEEDHKLHTVFKIALGITHLGKSRILEGEKVRLGVFNVK